MKRIYVATKVRGFLVNLFESSFEGIEFVWKTSKVYEVNSRLKLWIAKIIKSNMGNHLGIIQRINVKDINFSIAFSYNRFLKVKKNYILYLENPTAPFHYCLGRNETLLGKRKIKKYLSDSHLKAIVSISKACHNTNLNFYQIPETVIRKQIYPLVPSNPYTTTDTIKIKSYRSELKCLYISSDFTLKGGKDIIESFKIIKKQGITNISLKIITRIDLLERKLLQDLQDMENIEVYDFTFNKKGLESIYNDSNILLNPTRQDSFPLVVLESMKAGNVVLSSDLYAIPEMVINSYNGYLTAPKYRFFDYENMPNKQVWNNRDETIYSDYIDQSMIKFICEKLIYLNNNRDELERLAMNAYEKSNVGELSETYIKQQWIELINEI